MLLTRLAHSFVVSGSNDLTVKVWILPAPVNDGEVLQIDARLTGKAHDSDINSITVSPNDKLFATGSMDKTAKVLQRSTVRCYCISLCYKMVAGLNFVVF